jgi:hypothetical protein
MSTHTKKWRRTFQNNCAILEKTADGVPVGRCWHYLTDGQCPRHGDVAAVQKLYVETGQLTAEVLTKPH